MKISSFITTTAKKRSITNIAVILSVLLLLGVGVVAEAQTKTLNSDWVQNEKPIKLRASGTFEVKVTPLTSTGENANFVRLLLEKQFHGDLQGSSKGEMLTVSNGSKASAGYVAMERISGTLNGRQGTFALQHSGTMTEGKMDLSIKVVPESGTGELAGLAGQMSIKIDDKKHFFDFEYTLPQNPVIKTKD